MDAADVEHTPGATGLGASPDERAHASAPPPSLQRQESLLHNPLPVDRGGQAHHRGGGGGGGRHGNQRGHNSLAIAATMPNGIQGQAHWESSVALLESAPCPELRHFALTCMLRHTAYLRDEVPSTGLRHRIVTALADISASDQHTANGFVASYLLAVAYGAWGSDDPSLRVKAWTATLSIVRRVFPKTVLRAERQTARANGSVAHSRRGARVSHGSVISNVDDDEIEDRHTRRRRSSALALQGLISTAAIDAADANSAPSRRTSAHSSVGGDEGETKNASESGGGTVGDTFGTLQQQVWAIGALGHFLGESSAASLQHALCEALLLSKHPLSTSKQDDMAATGFTIDGRGVRSGVIADSAADASILSPAVPDAVLRCEVLRSLRTNLPDTLESRHRVQGILPWVYAFARYLTSRTCTYSPGLRRHATRQVSLFTSRW